MVIKESNAIKISIKYNHTDYLERFRQSENQGKKSCLIL
ncbi:hypothetical protein EV06_1987 [Prochlorococcus sp. MIT 0602]|nr:hypothetical protein EV06_1987 [Prochlorococcus sp. MIT 0602]KGG15646.1 hypothetical protein EV07_1611 [Prochlorococcus sp. MIT 0603]